MLSFVIDNVNGRARAKTVLSFVFDNVNGKF